MNSPFESIVLSIRQSWRNSWFKRLLNFTKLGKMFSELPAEISTSDLAYSFITTYQESSRFARWWFRSYTPIPWFMSGQKPREFFEVFLKVAEILQRHDVFTMLHFQSLLGMTCYDQSSKYSGASEMKYYAEVGAYEALGHLSTVISILDKASLLDVSNFEHFQNVMAREDVKKIDFVNCLFLLSQSEILLQETFEQVAFHADIMSVSKVLSSVHGVGLKISQSCWASIMKCLNLPVLGDLLWLVAQLHDQDFFIEVMDALLRQPLTQGHSCAIRYLYARYQLTRENFSVLVQNPVLCSQSAYEQFWSQLPKHFFSNIAIHQDIWAEILEIVNQGRGVTVSDLTGILQKSRALHPVSSSSVPQSTVIPIRSQIGAPLGLSTSSGSLWASSAEQQDVPHHLRSFRA